VLARGATGLCTKYRGGKRCKEAGCDKHAQCGTGLCTKHGGVKRCKQEGCKRLARDGTGLCTRHMPRCRAAVCADEPGAAQDSCSRAGWPDKLTGLKLCRSHKAYGSSRRRRLGALEAA
jgi:hypothetical protein